MKLAPRVFLFALVAALPVFPAAAATVSPLRSIAIAEDQRRWSDGELRGHLADPASAVRARAALAVGRLQDTTSVSALLPLLKDGAIAVRREAVFALGQIGHRSARAAIEAMLADRDPEVVVLAVEALGKLGDKAATPRLVPLLASPSPHLRATTAVAFWRLADSTAVPALIAALPEHGVSARWRMVYALEKVVQPATIVPAVTPLLRDRDALVRAHAARTLGRQKSAQATSALLLACADDSGAVVVNAVRALQQVADSTAAGQLKVIARLLAHADPYVTVTAATALGDAFAWGPAPAGDAREATAALRAATSHADAATRGSAARALLVRFGAAERAAWSAVANDVASEYARAGALDGLRSPRAAELAPLALGAALGADRKLIERMTAADIAGSLYGRDHPAALKPLLPLLRAGVGDANTLFAAACAGALGDWGDTASVALLTRSFAARGADADPDARQAIQGALTALAGAPYADSVARAHAAPAPAAATYAPDFESLPRERRAVLRTSEGVIEWELLSADAPQTVRNFVKLARKGYFDGLRVHRVVPDFVIQDGDPSGTGSGGPGWTIRCEYNQRRYETGMVGMALSGKDTGGSQWFITLSPQPHLDGRYTIFARVTRGQAVAARMTQGGTIHRVDILP
ncbi:MAG: peptidylprolyl isomerase [Candidatus Eisenbacteria bacterium]|nr:peptidylprolyl isomerase [Candidatus Eisenbacteria bacterium]